MEITLRIFLYAYLVFLVFWAGFFAVGLYHMFKYGFKTVLTSTILTIMTGVAVLMLAASFYFISTVDDWDEPAFSLPAWNDQSVDFY